MSRTPPEMSPAEFAVMKALWRLGRGTVAEIRAEYSAAVGESAYTTVMTLLGRLADKGAVRVDKRRQPYTYRPAFRRESVLRKRLRDFVDVVFDGSADSLVMQLLETDRLSVEELREIERQLSDEDDE